MVSILENNNYLLLYYTASHSNGNAPGEARAEIMRLTILSVGMMGDPCHPMLISTEEEKPSTSCCLIASFSSSSTGNLHLFRDRDWASSMASHLLHGFWSSKQILFKPTARSITSLMYFTSFSSTAKPTICSRLNRWCFKSGDAWSQDTLTFLAPSSLLPLSHGCRDSFMKQNMVSTPSNHSSSFLWYPKYINIVTISSRTFCGKVRGFWSSDYF